HIIRRLHRYLPDIDDNIAGFDAFLTRSGTGSDVKNRNSLYIFGNAKFTSNVVIQFAELHAKHAWSRVALLVLFRRIRCFRTFISAFSVRKRSLIFRRSLGALVILDQTSEFDLHRLFLALANDNNLDVLADWRFRNQTR